MDQWPPNVAQAALVNAWANSEGLALDSFPEGAIRELLDSNGGEDLDECTSALVQTGSNFDLKQLERGFEVLLGTSKRKSLGAVYTPDPIISYLCEEGLELSASSSPKVCDPFCGSGGFLIGAAESLHRRTGISRQEAIEHNIHGYDIDPQAIQQARLLIEAYLLTHDPQSMSPKPNLTVADTFLELNEDESGVSSVTFDLVVTNPPYVKLQNLEADYRRLISDRYPEFASGSFSLALLFLVAGHGMLTESGILACITQNNFFTSIAGQKVRNYLRDQGAMRRIVDFGYQQVFPGVSTYTCLLFLGRERDRNFQFERLKESPTSTSLSRCDFSLIDHSALDDHKWRLAKQPHLANLLRIESSGSRLGELADIKVGFATLKDSVFLITDKSIQSKLESDILVPAIKVSDLGSPNLPERRLIFPYQELDGRFVLYEEDVLKERFPRAYAHLAENREHLESREKGKSKTSAWFAWGRTQGMRAPGPKLLTKTFNKGPKFYLDTSDSLFCNGYSVSIRPSLMTQGLTLAILQTILQSRVFYYYAKLTSFQIEGGYECYQKNFIERFSIPSRLIGDAISVGKLSEQQIAAAYEITESELDEVLG